MKVDYTYEAYNIAVDLKDAFAKGFGTEVLDMLNEGHPDVYEQLVAAIKLKEITDYNSDRKAAGRDVL